MVRFLILLFSITSLNFFFGTAASAQKKPAARTVVKTAPKTMAIAAAKTYQNGIKLKLKGFKVKDAYLVLDDGTRVDADNKVDLNTNVNMLVIIESGWNVKDSLVYPGASEKIKLSNGFKVLESEDFFKIYDQSGVSAEDAQYITLKAVITSIDDNKNFVIVTFRVWDKKGTAEITGTYNLYIK